MAPRCTNGPSEERRAGADLPPNGRFRSKTHVDGVEGSTTLRRLDALK